VAADRPAELIEGDDRRRRQLARYTTDYSQAAPIAPQIVFGDAMVGYATVRGEIQRTTDGGAHWTKIKTPGTA